MTADPTRQSVPPMFLPTASLRRNRRTTTVEAPRKPGGGEGMVVPVSPRLVVALAAADEAALRDAAQAWSCTEELAAWTACICVTAT